MITYCILRRQNFCTVQMDHIDKLVLLDVLTSLLHICASAVRSSCQNFLFLLSQVLIVACSPVCMLFVGGDRMKHVIVQDSSRYDIFNLFYLNWSNRMAYIKSSMLKNFVVGETSCYSDVKIEFVTRCSYKGAGVRLGWESYTMYYCKYGT